MPPGTTPELGEHRKTFPKEGSPGLTSGRTLLSLQYRIGVLFGTEKQSELK